MIQAAIEVFSAMVGKKIIGLEDGVGELQGLLQSELPSGPVATVG